MNFSFWWCCFWWGVSDELAFDDDVITSGALDFKSTFLQMLQASFLLIPLLSFVPSEPYKIPEFLSMVLYTWSNISISNWQFFNTLLSSKLQRVMFNTFCSNRLWRRLTLINLSLLASFKWCTENSDIGFSWSFSRVSWTTSWPYFWSLSLFMDQPLTFRSLQRVYQRVRRCFCVEFGKSVLSYCVGLVLVLLVYQYTIIYFIDTANSYPLPIYFFQSNDIYGFDILLQKMTSLTLIIFFCLSFFFIKCVSFIFVFIDS